MASTHNPPSARPDVPLHPYTPLALILLFWLTSAAALACPGSTNIRSISFLPKKHTQSLVLVVDSHQGSYPGSRPATQMSMRCIKINRVNTLNLMFLLKKLHLHTGIVRRQDLISSCVCRVSQLSGCFAFPSTCDSDGSIFNLLFLRLTQIRLSCSLNNQPPSFIPDSFSGELALLPFFRTKLTSQCFI